LPFFLPSRLVEFEYLGSEDAEHINEAEPYLKDMDFAFFVVNFGYSKKDYENLTMREKAFIMKAWENKLVLENSLLNNAVAVAISNSLRKKGGKVLKLFKPKPKKVDKDKVDENLKLVKEIDQAEGMDWVKKVYFSAFRKL